MNTYQKIPTYIDQVIEQCEDKRIIEHVEDDAVAGDFFDAFDSWKDNLFRLLRKDVNGQHVVIDQKLSIGIVSSSRNLAPISEISIVLQNKVLTKATATEAQLPQGQTYTISDYLTVLPTNLVEIFCRVLKRFNLSSDTLIGITFSAKRFFPTNHSVSAFDILSSYVELGQPIARKTNKDRSAGEMNQCHRRSRHVSIM